MGYQTGRAARRSGSNVTTFGMHDSQTRQFVSAIMALFILWAHVLFGQHSAARVRRGGRL